MAGASIAYILLTIALYKLTSLGDTSVIYANIINLSARILYCSRYISSYVHRLSKGKIDNFLSSAEILPPRIALAMFLISGLITHASFAALSIEDRTRGAGKAVILDRTCQIHVGVGVACGLMIIGAW